MVVCAAYAAICLYIVYLIYDCFCLCYKFKTKTNDLVFLNLKKKSGIETPDQNGKWYQHPTLFAFFYESNAEGTNFWIVFMFMQCACFVCKCPEMTLCGWRG